MQQTDTLDKGEQLMIFGKKQKLKIKKQKKIKEQTQTKNKKKEAQNKKQEQDESINLQDKEIIFPDPEQYQANLEECSKKLKKMTKKTANPKPPAKIKVKNKFFSDINIEVENTSLGPQSGQKNLVQEQISNKQSKQLANNPKTEIVVQKHKQASENFAQSKLTHIVSKTDFIRARHDYKKVEEDSKFKSYVKKKIQQVQEAQEVIIEDIEVPLIHRNKLISSSIYVNHESFKKKEMNKNAQQNETPKKKTATQIVQEKKMMKNRDYFFKKLEQKIKEQRAIKNKQTGNDVKNIQKVEKRVIQNFQQNKLRGQQKVVSLTQIHEKSKQPNKTSQLVLTENFNSKN